MSMMIISPNGYYPARPAIISQYVGGLAETIRTTATATMTIPVGDEFADRLVVVGLHWRTDATVPISSDNPTAASMGGSAAALYQPHGVIAGSGIFRSTALVVGRVPAGTSTTLQLDFLSAKGRAFYPHVFSVLGAVDEVPTSTAGTLGTNSVTETLNVEAGGCLIGAAMAYINATIFMTGATERYRATTDTFGTILGFSDDEPAATTKSVTVFETSVPLSGPILTSVAAFR